MSHAHTAGEGSLLLEQAVVDALFAQSPLGLFVFDTELRLIRVNTAARGMRGVLDTDILGRGLADIVPGFDTEALEGVLRRVLETGEPVLDAEHRGRPPADPDREHVISVSVFRLHAGGRVLGALASAVDITERTRARERMDLLQRAATDVGTLLDAGHTARELADVVVPELACAVAVDVLDSVSYGEVAPGTPTTGAAILRRAAARSAEHAPGRPTRPEDGELVEYPFATAHAQALADLRPRLIPRLDARERDGLRQVGLLGPRAVLDGAHSLMLVPLAARGLGLGMVTFARRARPQPFTDDDLTLAVEITGRTALSIDNARRFTREHVTASVLQRSLLPSRPAEHAGVESAACYLPGTFGDATGPGGDWFDVIPLSGARVALVVGDVVGRGLQAAATMGRLRAAIHAFAALDLPPDELLGHLDHLAIRLADEPHHPFDADPTIRQPLGATCLYAVYDPVSGRLQLARAGHPPPLAVLPDGATRLLDVAAGPPLGLGGVPFEAADLEIEQGTVLALYTDGLLSSCPTEPDAALNRLGRVLAHPLRPIQEACDQAVRALVPHPPNDDAVLLTVRTRTLGGDRVATWTLPADPQVVSTARDLAARQLGVWNLGALAFATELVVSELVTNAIRYGSGTVSLRLILDRALICEVSDGSNTAPHVRQARATDEGGRGLMLVAGLSPRWGVRQSARGKTVWAEIALTPE